MVEKYEKREAALESHDAADLAAYIGDMSAELAVMARQAELEMLARVLELASMTAQVKPRAQARQEEDAA